MADILTTDVNNLYLRKVSLTIIQGEGESKLLDGLRISFDAKKNSESNTNQLEIKVYNLSATTRGLLEDKKTRIILQAGYENTTATIFQGNITKTIHKKNNVDIISTLEIGDGDNAYRHAKLDKGYPPGISIKQAIDDLGSAMKLPFSSKLGITDFKFSNGLSLEGNVRDNLDMLTKKLDLKWSIQDETVQITPQASGTTDSIVELSEKTGLINIPEKTEEGVEFETLLYPTLRPGRRVKIVSKFVNGIYTISTVKHKGDSHGNVFKTKCEAA